VLPYTIIYYHKNVWEKTAGELFNRFILLSSIFFDSSVNKRDKGETTDGNLEIRVVCDIPAHNSEASESEDSVTSTSKLIQANLEPQHRLNT
jgi:hypothetical protein